MGIIENINQALRAIKGNFLRFVLTASIIALGITALVGILTAIDSILYSMSTSFSGIGANSYTIRPSGTELVGRTRGRTIRRSERITFRQAMILKERYERPDKLSVSILVSSLSTIKYGNESTNPNVTVRGIDENYLFASGIEIEYGRNFSALESEKGAQRVIIGKDIVKSLFGGKADQALDKIIRIGSSPYRVIGIIASQGSGFDQSGDRQVMIPLLNGRQMSTSSSPDFQIKVAVTNPELIDASIDYATGIMRSIRKLKPGDPNDFEMRKSDSILNIIKENTVTLRAATIGIGIVTLLGAAIGLMNIMLVSVTERTREIGISKALGATRSNILIQFLTESIVICQIGGIFGVILGILTGNVVTLFVGGSFLIPWVWIISGLITCFVVGLASGIYPATKAASMDPIESLRYE